MDTYLKQAVARALASVVDGNEAGLLVEEASDKRFLENLVSIIRERYGRDSERMLRMIERALEAHDGAIEILGVGWRCRICGRFTASPDKLCWGHRIEGEGICKRCGRRLKGGSTLCDSCFEQLARAMGLA